MRIIMNNYQLNPLYEFIGHFVGAGTGALAGTILKYSLKDKLIDSEIDNSNVETLTRYCLEIIDTKKKQISDNEKFYLLVIAYHKNPCKDTLVTILKYIGEDENSIKESIEIIESHNGVTYKNYFGVYDCPEIADIHWLPNENKKLKHDIFKIRTAIKNKDLNTIKNIVKRNRIEELENKSKQRLSQRIPTKIYALGGAALGGLGYHYAKKGIKTLGRSGLRIFKK